MNRQTWLVVPLAIVIGCGGSEKGGEQPPDRSQQPGVAVPATPEPSGKVPAAKAGAPEAPPGQAPKREIARVREPAVAGMFYEKHPETLQRLVDGLLQQSRTYELGRLKALVCPHAGYNFSGITAAIGYKQAVGRGFRTAVVLAPTHYAHFSGASIPDVDAYRTPLGLIPLSPKAAELAKVRPFVTNPSCRVMRPDWWRHSPKKPPADGRDTPHTWEHSLEVQLPFCQRALGDFELIPAVLGEVDPRAAAAALQKFLDDKTVVVASSDLSHFYPYETACRLDAACVKAICNLDVEAMKTQEACGKRPILTVMYLALMNGWKTRLLDCRNSGDTSGDKARVVGYAAVAFYAEGPTRPATAAAPAEAAGDPTDGGLSGSQRQYLLRLARETLTRVVTERTLPKPDESAVPESLKKPVGCFVTLKRKGKLRGCIGYIFPKEPLYKAVIEMACAAALRDRRFQPVAAAELGEITIELSVLTVPQPLKFALPADLLERLRPGVDGVVFQLGRQQATYLPQVWQELPDKEEFLSKLSRKAGLPAGAWKAPGVTILTYQAAVFGESEPRGADAAN